MADQQVAAALASIAQVLQALQQQNQPAPARPPILQHYDAATPFDLRDRAGSAAFDKACAPLDEKWDGTLDKLPNFIIALQMHATECKWDAPDPNGILTYQVNGVNKNILTEYHSLTETIVSAARVARTDARAIQNARAFYFCLRESLCGDIRAVVFEQLANLPEFEDGGSLFYTITTLSMASSLQLTIQTIQTIQSLEPSDFDYKISALNTRLTHLFMLAASVNRQLGEAEKLQHTLTIYSKIKQPESWAQWVRGKIEAFDENNLTSCQALMNAATLKQIKIRSDLGDFRGRSTTIQEDVVAMLANKTKRPSTGKRTPTPSAPTSTDPTRRPTLPPFVRHFKASAAAGGAKYVVGDSKPFEGVTWHFCGCPKHRDNIKWHTHTADTCRIRQKWLSEGGVDGHSTTPEAHVLDASDSVSDATTDLSTITGDSDVMALLAHALSAVGDNTMAKALIADALSAIQDS